MLIKNARDYEGRICDYLIADGKIRAIGTDLPEAGEVINAEGLTILPRLLIPTAIGVPPALNIKRILPPALRLQRQADILSST